MILGYKLDQFEEKIEDGTKIHTIRGDAHNRWKIGMLIQHARNVRTKKYRCFKEGQCMSLQSIEILYHNKDVATVFIDGKVFKNIGQLAAQDGFHSVDEFWQWFNKDFTGKIIHFTDFKY